MRLNTLTILITSVLLAAAALAGEEHEMKIEIAVDDGASAPTVIRLDSDAMGFKLHELQEGESRSVVDDTGQSVLVTRMADGFVFDVDGKKIKVPSMHDDHMAYVSVDADRDSDMDIDVRVMKRIEVKGDANSDDVTIISGKTLDDSTKEAIRSVLISAGHAGKTLFLDGSELHGDYTMLHGSDSVREIRIISPNEEDVTN
jgi:hypothetical protein